MKYAFDRFYEAGFHATGMEAALAGSGISKRTLYKYFSSKEELIEAVLRLYSKGVVHELFDPVAHISDPREQIIEFFDVSKIAGRMLTRGCLGMKAAQEYAGKHDGIVELGIAASSRGEVKFLELCKRAGFAKPQRLAKQLNLLLQGALALSHASGETSAFLLAKDVALTILDNARPVQRARSGS
ncbi:TetR/AcrR family transcriptional regulator [Paraburkholderia edwinii]|uniref:TetR/AcrR family transcriptional regulator n=1 Tax=Paraburkholderia edwinii TaxID=2861782 RepID=A0ABX8UUW2_9BURK|nr:TetR/AcrR family transcriptional regulator [Paraburkholderia edwinii]QYD72795.1 TetR/AcrR family transcriptional regulator [Paraburkholderia edwinii]